MASRDRSNKPSTIADKAAVGANNVYGSLQFASVQDSRENLFSTGFNNGFNTPMPPKFVF